MRFKKFKDHHKCLDGLLLVDVHELKIVGLVLLELEEASGSQVLAHQEQEVLLEVQEILMHCNECSQQQRCKLFHFQF